MQRRSDLMQENGSKNTSRMVLDLVMGRCGLKRNGEPIELVDSPAQMPLAFHVLAVFPIRVLYHFNVRLSPESRFKGESCSNSTHSIPQSPSPHYHMPSLYHARPKIYVDRGTSDNKVYRHFCASCDTRPASSTLKFSHPPTQRLSAILHPSREGLAGERL